MRGSSTRLRGARQRSGGVGWRVVARRARFALCSARPAWRVVASGSPLHRVADPRPRPPCCKRWITWRLSQERVGRHFGAAPSARLPKCVGRHMSRADPHTVPTPRHGTPSRVQESRARSQEPAASNPRREPAQQRHHPGRRSRPQEPAAPNPRREAGPQRRFASSTERSVLVYVSTAHRREAPIRARIAARRCRWGTA